MKGVFLKMKTSKDYLKNLKNRIITKEMLSDCLVSVNKRAKNHRDKEREIRWYRKNRRYFYDVYDSEEKAREKKEEYYEMKEELLAILDPVCIHKEFMGYKRIRVYDYEKEYKNLKKKDQFVWENSYYDRELDRRVWFGDYEDESKPQYNYYLFYDMGTNNTFHSPITEEKANEYNLQIIDIDHLETHGKDISELVSVQFVNKVIGLIYSKDYVLKLS